MSEETRYVRKGLFMWLPTVFIGIVSIGLVVGGAGIVLGWFGETAEVAREEFGPRAALQKYEWFKDASASLDKLQADITNYEKQIASIRSNYDGKTRAEWLKDDREESRQLEAEMLGIKARYNGLAAEYNASMAKFNHSFANAGQLPQGATNPLPSEYKPYD